MARFGQWISAVTLALVIAAFGYFAWATAQQNVALSLQSQAAARTEQALCILRADLQTRVDSARQFLVDNPKGIPGISVEQIQQSIDNQQRTILALQLLECP